MKRLAPGFLTALLVFATLALHVTPASAAFTRYIRATNLATGPGVCSIIIESFGLLATKGPEASQVQSFNINVPIPNNSTPTNTALLIRNALAAGLPGDYLVTVVPGAPTFVQVYRNTGTFTMAIDETVPTQIIVEDDLSLPFLGGPALALLGVLLALASGLVLRSRRRVADGAS